MAEIKFSPKALSDLRQTRAYIAEELCNDQAADNIIKKITKKISTLAEFPEIGAPLSSIVDIETEYRFLVCDNYTAYYRIEDKTVHIVRVLYGRRNFMRILFGKPNDN